MIYWRGYEFRTLISVVSVIFVNLAINLEYGSVEAGPTQSFRFTRESHKKSCHETCQTLNCVLEASNYMGIMNTDVDPCDDFYKFACGNFIKEKVIIDQAVVINAFSMAQTVVANEIFNEIITDIKPDDLDAFKKTKMYFQNCMNEALTEQEGLKPLHKILDKIGGWPVLHGNSWPENKYDWKEAIYNIKDQKFLIFFPMISIIDIDNKNSTKNIIKMQCADTAISRTFLLDGPDNTLMKAYYDFMINISIALGANKDAAFKEMKDVLDFEVALYKIKTPPEELLNQSESNNQMTIKELSQKHPSIPWLKILNKIFNPSGIYVNENETVHIIDYQFISKIEKLINTTPKRVLANYFAWSVVRTILMYLPENLRDESANFMNILEGTKKRMNQESWCLNEIMEAFPISISAMFIRKHFNKKIKDDVFEMVQNIKNQTKKNLEEVDWMDDKTRKAALEKLNAMGVSVGYADELMDDKKVDEYYSELEINPGTYLQAVFNITSFLEKQNYRTLRKSMEKNPWTLSRNAALINAYYILQRNTIEIPAGFLRSFYQSDRPQYLNYGAIGTMIGHEITHGFDNQGRKYDKNGNENNWWQAGTEEKFFRKAKCIIDQYNNFTVAEVGLQVNGITTQGENIADNGGFKSSYHAYNEWVNRNKISEPCLPFLPYTQRQMFWISAASNWCSKQRPEYLKDILSTDEHSPENARIIISFSNMEEFAQDFQCKVGSKMNPKNKCIIW